MAIARGALSSSVRLAVQLLRPAACCVPMLLAACLGGCTIPGARPVGGFIPDEATAIRVAIAIWEPIYGRDAIANEAPYVARLEGGTWIVKGTLCGGQKPDTSGTLPDIVCTGGTAEARIRRADGRVLRVVHWQ
jgi:NTF2 fold immunity protein